MLLCQGVSREMLVHFVLTNRTSAERRALTEVDVLTLIQEIASIGDRPRCELLSPHHYHS